MHIHTPIDSRLKYCAHREFQLVSNRLIWQPNSKFLNVRYTVPENEISGMIIHEQVEFSILAI